MTYKHTQIGYLILFVFVVVALLFGNILMQRGFHLPIILVMLLILCLLVSFGSLQVVIDEHYLRIKFGYGVFRKTFLLKDILSAQQVRNHGYYGWGIRFWLWPRMWIYNVSGFDAVEIKTRDGKIYRIGTDEPQKVEQILLQAMERIRKKK